MRNRSYRANYNEYQSARVSRNEYGVLYNDHQDSQLLVNDGGVVQECDSNSCRPTNLISFLVIDGHKETLLPANRDSCSDIPCRIG